MIRSMTPAMLIGSIWHVETPMQMDSEDFVYLDTEDFKIQRKVPVVFDKRAAKTVTLYQHEGDPHAWVDDEEAPPGHCGRPAHERTPAKEV